MSAAPPSSQSDRARAMWRSCLASALRTGLACTIVGIVTLFGPANLCRQIAFPAFSYVTVILIVTNATVGDTFRGCWLALSATVQGVCPAILSLWAIGPARLTTSMTAAAVALAAFVVVLPENTHLLSKRIALGQIVILYVIAYINGVHTEPVMHPVHVAASTATGVIASVLAFLLPYPSLACCEVKQNCRLFVDNASERLKLFVNAFCAEDGTSISAIISQAKPLAATGTKLLQSIKSKQDSMQWEIFPFKFLKPSCMNLGELLQEIQMPLKGMEIALSNSSFAPPSMLDKELKDSLLKLKEHTIQTFYQTKSYFPFSSSTVQESNKENLIELFQTLRTLPTNQKDLPFAFFLFCLNLLQSKSVVSPRSSSKGESTDTQKQDGNHFFKGIWKSLVININYKRFIAALKCSLSLGLATLFGLVYSKENGIWAGLPVALTLPPAREATFKVANIKAQGTVLGTVYGVLGCFLFEKYVQVRFISLLPWFIFSAFLQRSRIYGQAGGVSAVIGAVLILGRKNFGPPSDFAIARITETFIGLSCSILVEILLQPTRASTLAKIHLSKSLQTLHECVDCLSLCASKSKLEDIQKMLKVQVNELRNYIGEAEAEPNFWFLPFRSACYNKLLGSLSKMVDLLLFVSHAIGFLEQESERILDSTIWEENIEKLDERIEEFKELVCPSIRSLEVITSIDSLPRLEKKFQDKKLSIDMESGKLPNPTIFKFGLNEDETDKTISCYLQHLNELVDDIKTQKDEKDLKAQLAVSLAALAFCITCIVKETKEVEKGIKELIQLENPSNHVNLNEILCKKQALEIARDKEAQSSNMK